MILFSGVSMDPRHNPCHVEGCKNGAVTSVWNYPGVEGRRQFDLCAWHVKDLYEKNPVGVKFWGVWIKRTSGGWWSSGRLFVNEEDAQRFLDASLKSMSDADRTVKHTVTPLWTCEADGNIPGEKLPPSPWDNV